MKFDSIVGNPPYNPPKNEKRGHITHNLWEKFVINSIESLNNGGFLCYIHPPMWRKPNSKIFSIMKNNGQLKTIKIFDSREAKTKLNFPVKVDYYLFKKTKDNDVTYDTEIVNKIETTFVNIHSIPFIPNSKIEETLKIFSNDIETDVFYNCDYHHFTHNKSERVKREKSKSHRYPVLYLCNRFGPIFYYTNKKIGRHFGSPKIIIPMGRFQPILDLEGKIGMCEVAFAIMGDKKYLKNVFSAISTKKFNAVVESCRWKTMQLDYRLFRYLKKDFWKEFI